MLKKFLKYFFIVFFITFQIVSAQFYSFGRNKVHYESFDWKIIKTKHFDIYYYDNFEELAEIGANYAEEAYHDLKIKFNGLVTRRIPLIFYNTHIQFEQTNTTPGFIPEGVGGFFEFLKGRVVIPYLGSLEQFRHVIRHELVHVFMSNKLYNIIKNHRVSTDRYPPLWFVEGLAEYWSYHWDTQADMVMRDAVLNGLFVPLSDINRIRGTFLMYKEGQNFLQFVSQTYGEDKILLLMENFWRFKKFKKILEYTLGENLQTIDNKWVYHLKQHYYPLYKNDYPHSINSKKLTDEGFNFSPNYFKKDSTSYIYFIANRTGYTSVYELKYKPGAKEIFKPKLLIKGEKSALFESFHLLKPSLTVSSKGDIAFVNKSGGSDVINIYSIIDYKLKNTFRFDNLISLSSPHFSADGNQLVFNAIDRKGFSDLFILNIENGQLNRLTNDYYNDKDPIFGKDDRTVVFSSDRTDGKYKLKYNLFKYDLSTHKINYLTYVNANIETPRFSPDYSELFFNCDYDGTFNIWKLIKDADGEPRGIKQYSKFLTSVFDFTFVNDSLVITSSFEKFSFQFYELNLNSLPDINSVFVPNEFNSAIDKWLAKKLFVKSKREKLKYKRKYSLDYAVGQVITDPIYGTRGGAVLSLSDLMGDDRYQFLIYNTAEVQSEFLRNFNIAISRLNFGKRTNFGYGVFHFSGQRYDIRESDQFFFERIFGGFFSLIYPFSSFDRIEATVSLANSDRDVVTKLVGRKAILLSNFISYVHDNSLWGPTGPLDGSRLRVLMGYTTDVKFSNVNYYTFVADYRKYFRLGLRTSLATRTSIFINDGKEARRFIAGGSWDLRGWRRWSIRGEKLWLSSIELRFPLLDRIYVKFPFFGLQFAGIRGALFFDAGGAWDRKYTETLGSLGGGLRINLFRVITLRYDIGKKIEKNFTQFQPKLFYQFFFGWDF